MAKLYLFCQSCSGGGRILGFEWKVDEKAIVTEYRDLAIGCPYCFSILRLRLYPGFHKGSKEKAELVTIKDKTLEEVWGTSGGRADHVLYLKRWWSADIELCQNLMWATNKERKQVLKRLGILGRVPWVDGFVVPSQA